jgi:uncharacterized RDD family membrane protein YckC
VDARLFFGFVLVPAVAFAVAYHPILNSLSLALVSPYPKADLGKRFVAASVDVIIVTSLLVVYQQQRSESLLLVFVAGVYIVLRDAGGRSVGKFCCGLVVINLETGRPCTRGESISRNALLLLPGANLVALFLEAATIVRDPQGQRLGDRFAQTQVVEGFGARDFVAAVQRWWRDFIGQLEGNPRKPRRAPVQRRLIAGREACDYTVIT